MNLIDQAVRFEAAAKEATEIIDRLPGPVVADVLRLNRAQATMTVAWLYATGHVAAAAALNDHEQMACAAAALATGERLPAS